METNNSSDDIGCGNMLTTTTITILMLLAYDLHLHLVDHIGCLKGMVLYHNNIQHLRGSHCYMLVSYQAT